MANNLKYPTDPALREELRKFRTERNLMNPEMARIFGVNSTFISKYIGDKLDHDPKDFVARAWDTIKSVRAKLDLATTLFETSVCRAMAGRIDVARQTGVSVLFGAPAGEGKTSGGLLYQRLNPSALYFIMAGPERTAEDVSHHLYHLLRQSDWSPNLQRWPAMVAAVKGSQRPIICDNAHRLDTSGRNALFDFSEQTGCPVIMLGNPEILPKIRKNDQQHSRIGMYCDLRLADDELPAVARKVAELFSSPEAAEEIEDLVTHVAMRPGRLRAVRMNVILAEELRKKNASLGPRKAFRAAHKQLVRDYDLPGD